MIFRFIRSEASSISLGLSTGPSFWLFRYRCAHGALPCETDPAWLSFTMLLPDTVKWKPTIVKQSVVGDREPDS